MQINMELDTKRCEKRQQLGRIMGKDVHALLGCIIDDSYARHNVATGHDALKILNKNGFIGCLNDNGRLSEDYKQEL